MPDVTTPDRQGQTQASRDGLPYTVLSCCISLDGYISGIGSDRLMLSNTADFDRVDAVRAACDAILVGARTIRSDDPRLLVRSPARIAVRRERGWPEQPVKVTVTRGASLSRSAAFFATGGDKLVYCQSAAVEAGRDALDGAATVIDGGATMQMRAVSADLHRHGVRRMLIEGGGEVHTQFLAEDIADELHLAVAPVFVGDSRARRFVGDGRFPWHPDRRGRLVGTRRIGDVALLTYALSDRFDPGILEPDVP